MTDPDDLQGRGQCVRLYVLSADLFWTPLYSFRVQPGSHSGARVKLFHSPSFLCVSQYAGITTLRV